MADPRTRERIVELVRKMREHTVERGCTPGEAAKFAAKVAEWVEKYQIDEAELRAKTGGDGAAFSAEDVEVCENTLRTGKRVFNPGMTQVVNQLAIAMCCKCILLHRWKRGQCEAVYGIIGDVVDADYVCQLASTLVPSLEMMATLEGHEHGYEKAGLVRWKNQYLTGAAGEIRRRIEAERKERSDIRQAEHDLAAAASPKSAGGALMVITGESIATVKRAAAAAAFEQAYPNTKKTTSRMSYDHTANQRGREAGKRVGLHLGVEEK